MAKRKACVEHPIHFTLGKRYRLDSNNEYTTNNGLLLTFNGKLDSLMFMCNENTIGGKLL